MSNLPVREMVLYKHGVGFFVREGKLNGTSATLTFRADEVNDILKSLAVFDRAGGQVHGVHYQTPMDKAHRLANTSIRLSDKSSATQLIQQLRGRDASLLIEKANGDEVTYKGRVIGIEQQSHDDGVRNFITMKLDDGMVRVFPFDSLRGISIHDEQSEQDLSYFLDTSMSEDNRRSVTVRLSEGEHELVVYYVAPSPTWRVSYRLVAESDDRGETGKALLQGWGLFDNRLEEDLEDVRVTLVAGQPISFIYDLYESEIPQRPVVKDNARVVQKPVEYDSTKPSPAPMVSAGIAPSGGSLLKRIDKGEQRLIRARASEDRSLVDTMYDQIDGLSAETSETGTTFQYTVSTPVSIKRGESALVPIINEKISYQRDILYNKAKLAKHPVTSIRFENQSGLTLERGPITVVEDSDYAGEAIIPFVGDKQTVYIPYAVDLSINIKEDVDHKREIHSLGVTSEFLAEQEHLIQTTRYTIENRSDSDKVVTIEAPIQAKFELFNTPPPDNVLLTDQRWRVKVPARETVNFVKSERQITWKRHAIKNLRVHHLSNYFDNEYIDAVLLKELRNILNTIYAVNKIEKQIDVLKVEKDEIWVKQEEFRRNMKALGTTGKEGTLRLRAVDQLESAQDRLDAIEVEIVELKTQIEETEKQVDAMIAELGKKYPSDENNA